jgi:two-component system, LytTR family, response regulator
MSMMEAIRAAIIDDDDLGRRKISRLLKQDREVEIIGEFSGAEEAVIALRESKPELLCVDITEPGVVGMEILQQLSDGFPPVVMFVTAFDQRAVQAFQARGLDYVVKPFNRVRFHDTLRRAKDRVLQRRSGPVEETAPEPLADPGQGSQPLVRSRIKVKSAGRISFLKPEEIDWIEAQGDYVRLYVQGRKFLIREKIGEMEQQFSGGGFIRIHRSTIVNVERIKEMQPLFYGEYAVILNDGTRLTLSRSFRGKVFSRLMRA